MASGTQRVVLARPVLLIGGLSGLVLAGALALWAWYGTAVFFEVLRAGWTACF